MDLANVTIRGTIDVTIKNPLTGEDTDIIISVYSPESKDFKAAKHKVRNDRLQAKDVELTSEMSDSNSIKLFAAITHSWKNVEDGGEVKVCTEENAFDVYTQHGWIFEQVVVEFNRKSNFLDFAPQN